MHVGCIGVQGVLGCVCSMYVLDTVVVGAVYVPLAAGVAYVGCVTVVTNVAQAIYS